MVSFPAHKRSEVIHSTAECVLLVHGQLKHHHLSDSPVSEAHCPWRIPGNPIHDAQPRLLDAVLSLPTLTKLDLLCVHKKGDILLERTHEKAVSTSKSCFIFIQKLTYWFSHGHFLSSCLKTTRNRLIFKLPVRKQESWMNCHHTVH